MRQPCFRFPSRRLGAAALAALVALSATSAPRAAQNQPAMESTMTNADAKARVEAAAAKWDAAFNASDFKTLGSFYAANGAVVPAGGAPVEGPAAAAGFFEGLKAKGFDGHKIVVKSVTETNGVVVAVGTWTLTGPGESGQTQYGGNWIGVFGHEGDASSILLHGWN